MPNFFGVDIAQEVSNAISPQDVQQFTLKKRTPGSDTSGHLTAANHGSFTDYPCHGAITNYTQQEMVDAPLILKGDRRIVLVGLPLTIAGVAPEKDDRIVYGSRTYVVVDALADAALAHYECQCR